MNIIKPSNNYIKTLSKLTFSEITEKIKDEMAIPSYTHKNPLIRWLMWKRYEAIASLIDFSKAPCVYEFGCGMGLFLPTLNKYAKKVFARDLFPQYAKKLSIHFNLNTIFIENEDELEEIDIIIAADVLEHIEDLNPYLDKWHKKLALEGSLIVSGPTENFFYKIGRFIAGFSEKGDYHVSNINTIKATIEKHQFYCLKEIHLPFCFPPYLFKVLLFKKK